MKVFLAVILIPFASLPIRAESDGARKELEKFFSENMPTVVWPAKVEADFMAFVDGHVSTAAFIHKSSFSAPGVPSAVIISMGERTVCKHPINKLRVADYTGGRWRDVFRIERASNSILRVMNSSGTMDFQYEQAACIDLSTATFRDVPGLVILEALSDDGAVTDSMPWFYSKNGNMYVGTESMDYATENNIEGWFAYYFPENADKWPRKAAKTLGTLESEYKPDFIWKGNLLGTGNPAVFMLVYKGAPGPENKPEYMKGLSFYRLKVLEYREKWGGWKERMRADNGIYIDGKEAENANFGRLDAYHNLMLSYRNYGKDIGLCMTVAGGFTKDGWLDPCVGYDSQMDAFDATDFTKPIGGE
ncbi:MAG: hypothetical protein RDU13_00900 [Elusimicrobiales bacterium]|jgi:hypothetical protein|nr:hypothetical protein [Elusimicrobiales bacterium]